VLVHQPAGEGVVGEHQFLTLGIGQPGRQQRPAHPAGEFAGGLAGEGQPQHLFRTDRAGAHQPDHPGGHHGGLARTGTGDDHPGFQRCGDRGQLLLGERDPEQADEFRR